MRTSRTDELDTKHVPYFPTPALEPSRLPKWAELLTTAPRAFARNNEIFGQGQPVEYLYKVVEGAIRTSKILTDGRRQITGFYLSGDFLGIEAGEKHAVSAEALTDCKVLIIKRNVLAVLAEKNIEVATRLLELTTCELKRAQAHTTLLIMKASERVAEFLLEMGARAPKVVEIEPRQDIADYLGLTIETVSRVLGDFEAADIIARPTIRHVVVLNRRKLSLALHSVVANA